MKGLWVETVVQAYRKVPINIPDHAAFAWQLDVGKSWKAWKWDIEGYTFTITRFEGSYYPYYHRAWLKSYRTPFETFDAAADYLLDSYEERLILKLDNTKKDLEQFQKLRRL